MIVCAVKASPCSISVYAMSRSGHNSIIEWMRDNMLDPLTIIHNIEEADITGGVYADATIQVIILRDPYNWFASWVVSGRKWKGQRLESESPSFIARWKAQAREILGETHHLNGTLIPILYNKWVFSLHYRMKCAVKMGMGQEDIGALRVVPTGGGSTWDSKDFDGRANEMKVFDRWQSVEEDDLYRKYMLDPEIEDLSIRLFGMPCPLK